jgi:hypothetical protein
MPFRTASSRLAFKPGAPHKGAKTGAICSYNGLGVLKSKKDKGWSIEKASEALRDKTGTE